MERLSAESMERLRQILVGHLGAVVRLIPSTPRNMTIDVTPQRVMPADLGSVQDDLIAQCPKGYRMVVVSDMDISASISGLWYMRVVNGRPMCWKPGYGKVAL